MEFDGEFGNMIQLPATKTGSKRRFKNLPFMCGASLRRVVSWEIAGNLFVNYTFPHTLKFFNAIVPFKRKDATQKGRNPTRHKILARALSSQSATILGSFREIQISFTSLLPVSGKSV